MNNAASSAIKIQNTGPGLSPNRANTINQLLHEHKTLLQIVRGHPDVLDEYRQAVMSGANHPRPEVSKKQIEVQQEHL